MQTFLPYPDFKQSAQCLDRARLGKQRVEVLQMLRALFGETKGYRRHPATLMWSNSIDSLVDYGTAMCEEWISRGYRDSCLEKIQSFKGVAISVEPEWMGGPIHASHRAALLHKDFEWYSKFKWQESPLEPLGSGSLPYFWPKVETIRWLDNVK